MERNYDKVTNTNHESQSQSNAQWPKPIGQLLEELDLPDKMVRGESFLAKQHQDRKRKAQEKQRETVAMVDDSLQKLDQQLKAGKSEALVAFLSTMAKFHRYSFGNQLLIQLQRADATRVAGFNDWKKFGRHVIKGEKGIRILAPMIRKSKSKKATLQNPAEATDEENRLIGFRVVTVFDISQTGGKPLPEISKLHGEPGEYLPKARKLIRDNGIELTYEELHGPDGVSKGGAISITTGLAPANEFTVLVHELAHELMHRGKRRSQTNRIQRETEAEAVAYVVSQAIGIETTERTTDYIQLYRGSSELLSESLELIRATSIKFINALEKPGNDDSRSNKAP